MNENMEKQSLSLGELIGMMLGKWWLFVLAVVIAVVGSMTYTNLFVTPVYVSYGTMYISSATADITGQSTLSDVMLAQELVSTYSEILSSNTFMKNVAEESGLGYDYRQIRGRIKFSQKEDAPVVVVSVSSTDPKEAHILAETVLNTAQEEVSRVIPGGVVGIIDHAEEPIAPSGPNHSRSAILAAIIAVALVAVVVFCFEFFDDRIRGRQELQLFGFPVLVEIPYVFNKEEMEKRNKKRKKKLLKNKEKTA